MNVINLTGNIPVFKKKNQPSTPTYDNKYVIWDNDEKTLFKLDLETNVWESYRDDSVSDQKKIYTLFCFKKGVPSAHCSELVSTINEDWKISFTSLSGIECTSEDNLTIFTLIFSRSSNYECFIRMSGYNRSSTIRSQLNFDFKPFFIHHYNDKIWLFEYEKLKNSKVMSVNGQQHWQNITSLPAISGTVKLFRTQWPRSVLLVVNTCGVYSVGYIDLKYFTYIPVLEHNTSAENLRILFFGISKLYFIEDLNEEGNQLSKLWVLELPDFSRCFVPVKTVQTTRNMNFVKDFKHLSCMDEFKDFEIVGINKSSVLPEVPQKKESISEDQYDKSNAIKVHKAVLIARWPYFRTLIASGMKESQKNQLLIPEPTSWLKALVEYFYSDSIPEGDTDLCGGLLILARLYDLQQLKEVCLDYLFSMSTFQKAIKVWEFANIQGEVSLAYEASRICYEKWQDARPDDLENLDHSLLASLCLNNPYAKKQK